MSNLERKLNSVGKRIFVAYFKEFKTCSDKNALANKLLEENPNAHAISGQKARISCAKWIFEQHLEKSALNIIIDSKVGCATINKARLLLKTEECQIAK
jgi:hypothetical protein